jgi:hypothetical protein
MRKKDSKNYSYSKAEKLEVMFVYLCNELNNRIHNLPKKEQDRIEWAKRTCAWIEYCTREENSLEDKESLQFAGWEHYYVNRFPSDVNVLHKKEEKLVDYYVAEAN